MGPARSVPAVGSGGRRRRRRADPDRKEYREMYPGYYAVLGDADQADDSRMVLRQPCASIGI